MKYRSIFFISIILFSTMSFAQVKRSKSSASALIPEALGAKAFLEDLLARRYSQGLATVVNKQTFSIGVQLDLTEVPKKPAIEPDAEPLNDLMLGTLDPEELLKKYSAADDRNAVQGFLANYRIKTVTFSVGLSDDLAPEAKTDVEKWLSNRINSEFGKNGKGTVAFIKAPLEKKAPPVPPKTLLDLLNQFQSLAGQIVLALAIILGVLIWSLFGSPAAETNQESETTAGSATPQPVPTPMPSPANANSDELKEKEEAIRLSDAIEKLTRQLNGLLPKLTSDVENIVRSWCQMGDAGRIRLACFAEAVGKEVGKLPIPIDALPDVTKVFAKMTELSLKDKRDALEKAYWDLLATLNLGAESLTQPFGYLSAFNVGMINEVLIDQNPKMKTLVSLFMPTDLRSKYLRNLSMDSKREILQSAAQLSEIEASELKSYENSLMTKLKPSGSKETVALELTINKVVGALSAIEEVSLLSGIAGDAINVFKRSTPSLAFLGEWTDEKLSILLTNAANEELVALLRVRSELTDRVIRLCPTLTSEMVKDELLRPDTMNENDKNRWLEALSERLKDLVQRNELRMEEVFASTENAVASVSELRRVS
jgi:flagellar motor switch protein FliG